MRKYFLTGLVTLLPLAVTIWFVSFIVNFLTKPFMGIMVPLLRKISPYALFQSEPLIRGFSQLVILLALLALTIALGFVARRFFFKGMIKWGDSLLNKIPLVNKVYKTSKEIIKSLFASQGQSFKQVVLVPFPQSKNYSIGMITGEVPAACAKENSEERISVFIPAAPNPMTGFLLMVKKEDLIYLEMKTDEAFKYIVSCAVIQPKRQK